MRANGNHEGGRRRVTEGGLEEQHGLRESLRRGQPWDLVVSLIVTILLAMRERWMMKALGNTRNLLMMTYFGGE